MTKNRRLNIAVISTAENIPTEIETAWTRKNVCLEGPYSACSLQDDMVDRLASAVIDVRYDADVILSLMRKLDGQAVPYLFFVDKPDGERQGPFILSERSDDIEDIVCALIDQGAGVKH